MKTVCAIICTTAVKDNSALLKRCLESLHAAAGKTVKLKVVVNIETNQSYSFGKLKSKIHHVLESPVGSYYTTRHNQAIDYCLKKTTAEYLILINDDAWVEKDFFSQFVLNFNHQSDIVIPKILRGSGPTLDSFGVEYFRSGYSKNNVFESLTTQLASASCVMIRASFLRKIKKIFGFYFNDILGWYIEDVELFIRAKNTGGHFSKQPLMVAHHLGTTTWGRNSYFPVYQNTRNILWVIIMTWPTQFLRKNLINIMLVQLWVFLYTLIKFGPRLYFTALHETFTAWRELQVRRKKILSSYRLPDEFEKTFSSVSFRTKYGQVLPAVQLP